MTKAGGRLRRFLLQDEGLEMVEWSLVGVVFAVGCAVAWGGLGEALGDALGRIGDFFEGGPPCGDPPCGRGRGRR